MNWVLFWEIIYAFILVVVVIQILTNTQTATKTSAYILLVLLIPLVGIFVYLAFGLNYRKRELYTKKLVFDRKQAKLIDGFIEKYIASNFKDFKEDFPDFSGVSNIVYREEDSFTTRNNEVKLFINGESKFPALLQTLKAAKHHIHMEYYIYENDNIGNTIANLLIEKAKQGVKVRFIYDDFGSSSIRKRLAGKMKRHGVEVFPFYKIRHPIYFANRLNYRNHRKVVIVDGQYGFVGGINVSDKYINSGKKKLYWRDTHIGLKGEAVWILQKIFLADWNFCSGQNIAPDRNLFVQFEPFEQNQWTQVVASGPDSAFPSILYSYIQAIASAKKEVMITTPYFAPGESLMNALKMAALRGVKVQLLVPGVSDSRFVNIISKSHYAELLTFGIEIYRYGKGFVHAKTMVCDQRLAIVGTANIDSRSFDLNFEVNALIYDLKIAGQLKENFIEDLKDAQKIDRAYWLNRPFSTKIFERLLRLVSPLI